MKKQITLYLTTIFDGVMRIEGRLHSHGRIPDAELPGQYQGFGDAPWVRILPPRKRNPNIFLRVDPGMRYLLILEGTGHPDPIPLNEDCRDSARLKPWDNLIDKYIKANQVQVIADYRDTRTRYTHRNKKEEVV